MFIDDAIANILVNKTNIFANIHPNIFSCISIALNVPIFMALAGQQLHLGLIGAIVAARCLTDILDGAIARKYNKVSVLGGILDTVGDISLLCIVVWFMMRFVGLPVSVYIAFLLGLGGLMFTYDFWHDHAAAKIYSEKLANNCIAFFINNTVFFFAGLYGLILFRQRKINWNAE